MARSGRAKFGCTMPGAVENKERNTEILTLLLRRCVVTVVETQTNLFLVLGGEVMMVNIFNWLRYTLRLSRIIFVHNP